MNVWIVNHRFRGRQWCQARIREAGWDAPLADLGFVWAEWNGPERTIEDAVLPLLPNSDGTEISSVDPLVFGPRMYFDYCRKGQCRPQNRLDAGDLVLFACCHQNRIFLDIVFSIGAWKPWPSEQDSLPDWQDPPIDALARRVHYHRHALTRQHAEVRDPWLASRSYRGASDATHRQSGEPFSWVPWAPTPRALPLEISRGSAALGALQSIYRGTILVNGFSTRFSVKPCEKHEGAHLFKSFSRWPEARASV